MASSKLTLKKVKSLPPTFLLRIINKAKKFIKNDTTMKRICKEYGEDISIIDYIPTKFGDLDVSAKTDHGIVILNYTLLLDGFDKMDYGYLIHEYSHFFQQCCEDKATRSSDDGDYLQNPHEQEGFQNQVSFIAEHQGEDEAVNYVDDLLDHHEIDNKKEKKKLEDILLEKV